MRSNRKGLSEALSGYIKQIIHLERRHKKLKGYDIKVKSEVKGKPLECLVTMRKDKQIIRTVNLKYGGIYKVLPDNPLKLKHRDKVGVLMGFKIDNLGTVTSARIKFDETNKIGYVEVTDLVPFKNE